MPSGRWVSPLVYVEKCIICLLYARIEPQQVIFHSPTRKLQILIFLKKRHGIEGAGWARQENTVVMPDATLMAGVDMRLAPAGYRELHWHVAAEWSLVLNGSCRIQVLEFPKLTQISTNQAARL